MPTRWRVPRPRLLVLETWRSAAGDQTGSWTREIGPTSHPPPLTLYPPLHHHHHPLGSGKGGGGGCSAVPVVSLEMIAWPWARREDVLQLHVQDFQEEETSFSTRFFDISLPSGGIYEPRPGEPVRLLDKRIVCRFSLEN